MKKLSLPVREYNLAQLQSLIEKRVRDTSTYELVTYLPHRYGERGYALQGGYTAIVHLYQSPLFMPSWIDQDTSSLHTVILNGPSAGVQRFENICVESRPVVLIDHENHVAESTGLAWENRYPFKNFSEKLPDITKPLIQEDLQSMADHIFEVAREEPNRNHEAGSLKYYLLR